MPSQAKGRSVDMHIHDERALLALQGPKAASALQGMTKLDLSKFLFGAFAMVDLAGIPCFVTRTGYTGEDGFEISVPNERAVELTEKLMGTGKVHLAGATHRCWPHVRTMLTILRCRPGRARQPAPRGRPVPVRQRPDGGHLPRRGWLGVVHWCAHAWRCVAACVGRLTRLPASGKRRREKFDFLGGSVVQKQLADGATKRRIGLIVPAGAPARQHSKILDAAGKEVGEVTSGGFSPCLQKNIAMGACCRGALRVRARSPCACSAQGM